MKFLLQNQLKLLVQLLFPKDLWAFRKKVIEFYCQKQTTFVLNKSPVFSFNIDIQFISIHFNSMCKRCCSKLIYARKVLRIDRRQSHEKPSNALSSLTCEHIQFIQTKTHICRVFIYFIFDTFI